MSPHRETHDSVTDSTPSRAHRVAGQEHRPGTSDGRFGSHCAHVVHQVVDRIGAGRPETAIWEARIRGLAVSHRQSGQWAGSQPFVALSSNIGSHFRREST